MRWVYLAGWPKIHHLLRLPLLHLLLPNCLRSGFGFCDYLPIYLNQWLQANFTRSPLLSTIAA